MLLYFSLNIVVKVPIMETKSLTIAKFYYLAPYFNIYSRKAAI